MRLVATFSLALAGGILLVLAVGGTLQAGRETRLFQTDMARDHAILGRTLREVAEIAAADGGAPGAERLIRAAASRQRRVRVRWRWLDEPAADLTNADRGALAAGRTVRRIEHDTDGDRQVTMEPVALPGPRRAAIVLSEPMAPQRDAVRRIQTNALTTTMLSVVLCTLVAIGLGVWLVGRPIRRLCDLARRVGAGDLSVRLPASSRDEIGLLARELNGMVDQLAAARVRVAAETDARIAALEQLRHADRLRTVGQLAAGVAHELGTPLNVVSGRARMLSSGAAKDVARNADIIAQQADRMAGIIRHLLDFSRRRAPALAVDDAADVARQTVELLAAWARGHGARVVVDAPSTAVGARMDRGQIQQALTNLVVNAVQAMPSGGTVTLTVDCDAAVPPPDHGGTPGRWVRFRVQDDGPGIPPEHVARLFEPFFTTKDVGEGTGLGLAVAWGIVREHGGWIAVDGGTGRGACFTIHLPATDVAALPATGTA